MLIARITNNDSDMNSTHRLGHASIGANVVVDVPVHRVSYRLNASNNINSLAVEVGGSTVTFTISGTGATAAERVQVGKLTQNGSFYTLVDSQ